MPESKASVDSKSWRHDNNVAATVLIWGLTVAVCLLDWLTPLGYAIWLLYFIPLVLTIRAPRLNPVMLAMVYTLLVVAGFILDKKGIDPIVAFINRCMGVLGLWGVTLLLVRRQQLERALQQRETSYYALFMALGEGVLIQTRSAGITSWNPAAERILGLSGEQLLGLKQFDPAWQTIHEDGTPFPLATHPGAQVLETGVPQKGVIMGIRKPDDTLTWISVSASPTVGAHSVGDSAVMVSFTDISESKKAKRAMQAAAEYARSLLEASLDPLVTISSEGKITDVNIATEQVTGIVRSQLIGSDFAQYFTDPESASAGYHQVFAQGAVRDYPLAIRHAAGKVTNVLYNASVFRDSRGKVLGVFAAARDVTQAKRLEQMLLDRNIDLERAKVAAEAANLAKSNFLSSMSHELRTPLNAVLGFAQLLESSELPLTPAHKRSIEQILKAGWYLLELVNGILDLAQIESGQSVVAHEVVALEHVILECQSMVEPLARQRGIGVNFPRGDIPHYINADRTRIKQVLINLLHNAIKYNKPAGAVTVECALAPPNAIRISVRDTGPGLAPEQLAQLFQPFNRLGREAGAEQGTGIGLVVAKRQVELMGGSIGVESEVGAGSTFWIELSLAETARLD